MARENFSIAPFLSQINKGQPLLTDGLDLQEIIEKTERHDSLGALRNVLNAACDYRYFHNILLLNKAGIQNDVDNARVMVEQSFYAAKSAEPSERFERLLHLANDVVDNGTWNAKPWIIPNLDFSKILHDLLKHTTLGAILEFNKLGKDGLDEGMFSMLLRVIGKTLTNPDFTTDASYAIVVAGFMNNLTQEETELMNSFALQ